MIDNRTNSEETPNTSENQDKPGAGDKSEDTDRPTEGTGSSGNRVNEPNEAGPPGPAQPR